MLWYWRKVSANFGFGFCIGPKPNSGFGHTLVVCTLLYIALILFSTKSEKSYILHKFDYLFKNGFDPVVWEGIRAE